MRLFIFILSVMCFEQMFAQSTFYYSHIQPYSNQPFSIVESANGFFIAGRNSVQGGESNGFLMNMDKQGNLIWDTIIESPEPDRYEDYRAAVYHNDYFFVGGYRRINNNQRNLILKVNPSNGNIVTEKLFGDNQVLAGDNFISYLHPNEDGLLVATSGFDTVSMSTVAMLVQIDLDATILWKKIYSADLNAMYYSNRMTRIEPMENGFLLTMNSLDVPVSQTNQYIIRTDKFGNEIWRKNMRNYQSASTGTDTLLWFQGATPFKQKNVISHFIIDNMTSSSYTQNTVIVEFDENGNEIFYTKYPEKEEGTGPSDLFSDEDNNIYILGRQEVSPPYYSQMYAAKLNSEKEFLWTKHYGEKDLTELYFCGTLTSDGGVLIGGRDQHFHFGTPYFNSILVKTDCQGNTEWDYNSCMSTDLEELNLFPNPFSSYITIHIPNIPENSEVKIKLYNTVGKLVDQFVYTDMAVIQVNTNKHATGLYQCIVEVNGTIIANKKIVKAE